MIGRCFPEIYTVKYFMVKDNNENFKSMLYLVQLLKSLFQVYLEHYLNTILIPLDTITFLCEFSLCFK